MKIVVEKAACCDENGNRRENKTKVNEHVALSPIMALIDRLKKTAFKVEKWNRSQFYFAHCVVDRVLCRRSVPLINFERLILQKHGFKNCIIQYFDLEHNN